MSEDERYQLRRALADACAQCEQCRGGGLLYVTSGAMACPKCGPWRRLLKIDVLPAWKRWWRKVASQRV